MNKIIVQKQLHYSIIIECGNNNLPVILAGFDADEQTESILCRHLSNLCLQSDGSLSCTQLLISKLITQWQQSFKMNATETLKVVGNIQQQIVQSVCLYKTKIDGQQKLINRIKF